LESASSHVAISVLHAYEAIGNLAMAMMSVPQCSISIKGRNPFAKPSISVIERTAKQDVSIETLEPTSGLEPLTCRLRINQPVKPLTVLQQKTLTNFRTHAREFWRC
jgi:hypothetical protein